MLRLCSMRLCSKLLGGQGLTLAAFYDISTDSVLAQSLSSSWTSCLTSLRPFIEILQSLVTASVLSAGCVLYLCESAVFLLRFLISSACIMLNVTRIITVLQLHVTDIFEIQQYLPA